MQTKVVITLFFPSLNPASDSEHCDCTPLFVTHDLIDFYTFSITLLSTFPYDISFSYNIAQLIESNASLK